MNRVYVYPILFSFLIFSFIGTLFEYFTTNNTFLTDILKGAILYGVLGILVIILISFIKPKLNQTVTNSYGQVLLLVVIFVLIFGAANIGFEYFYNHSYSYTYLIGPVIFSILLAIIYSIVSIV